MGVEDDISEIPINNLTMEPDGEITLGNFNLLGLDKVKLNMTATGVMSLTNFNTLGVELNKLEMSAAGTTTLDANVINLNNGIRPAARQEDLTIISNSTDALFLTYLTALDAFMSSVFLFFNLHTHIGNLGGATSPPTPLLITSPPSHPSTITGKINQATNTSASVLIGD